MITRRALFALPALAACGRRRGNAGFRGYAFIANDEGQSIAVVDLEALAVAKHLPLPASPSQVVSAANRPAVYALTPAIGTVHEIAVDRLNLARKITLASSIVSMQIAPDDRSLYVLTKEPKSLMRVDLDQPSLKIDARLPLPEEPVAFALSPDGRTGAVTSRSGVRFVDLAGGKLREPSGSGEFGAVHFLADSRTLVAANRGQRALSLYDTATGQLVTHLPLSVRPDHLCFNADGGQLFVTGEGMDAVVVVFPFHTPQVAETVLAGHAPGPMAASRQFLFVANPASGAVSICEVQSRKVIAVVSVGTDPCFIAVTPDDQYALILNRASGDVSVLRTATITRNRDRRAALLTAIPVGARPVSAVVRAV